MSLIVLMFFSSWNTELWDSTAEGITLHRVTAYVRYCSQIFCFCPVRTRCFIFSWDCKFWVAWIECLVISMSATCGSRGGNDVFVVATSGIMINSALIECLLQRTPTPWSKPRLKYSAVHYPRASAAPVNPPAMHSINRHAIKQQHDTRNSPRIQHEPTALGPSKLFQFVGH